MIQDQIQGFKMVHHNIYSIYELLEHVTQSNNRVSESPSEVPVFKYSRSQRPRNIPVTYCNEHFCK